MRCVVIYDVARQFVVMCDVLCGALRCYIIRGGSSGCQSWLESMCACMCGVAGLWGETVRGPDRNPARSRSKRFMPGNVLGLRVVGRAWGLGCLVCCLVAHAGVSSLTKYAKRVWHSRLWCWPHMLFESSLGGGELGPAMPR